MDTYFITEKFIKDNTDVNNNVDMSKIDYAIKASYDVNLCGLIGSHFADYMLDLHQQVLSGTYVYSPIQESLVDKIQSYIAWDVALKANASLSNQLQNTGRLRQAGDFQQASDSSEVKVMAELNKTTAEAYKMKLSKFLCKNSKSFAEFMSDLNDDSDVKATCEGCKGSIEDLMDNGLDVI